MKMIREKIEKYKKWIIIGGGLIIIGLLAITIFNSQKADNMTALDIISAFQKEQLTIDGYEEITKDNDGLQWFGEEHRYISKVRFADSTDQMIDEQSDKYSSGAIEVYQNEEDVKIRIANLENKNALLEKYFPTDEYGEVLQMLSYSFNRILYFQEGNALLILGGHLDNSVIQEYQTNFTNILHDKKYDQVNVPTQDVIESMIKEDQESNEQYFQQIHEQMDEALQEVYTQIDTMIKDVEESLSQDDLNELKELVEYFHYNHYQEQYQKWTTSMTSIDKAIAEKEAKEAAAQKRAEELAKNKHSPGMYKVGTDIPAGEYILVGSGYFSISKDSSGSIESIIVNDNFSGNSIITVNNGEYLTVNKASFYEISLDPEISTSGEGMFKVGMHIPAGEYKLVSDDTYSGYYAVYSSSRQTLNTIITNNNFTGETYITVKNGQYLKLNRCYIKK